MTSLTRNQLQPVFEFLSALQAHNTKAWFDAHRADYDAAKQAVEALIEAVIDEFRPIEDFEDLTPKDCLFRINRDVRFAKDKSPYKINFGASLALGGKHSRRMPYYIHLQPGNQSLLAGGLYMPTPEQIGKVRAAIAADSAPLRKILRGKAFIENFGVVTDETEGRLKTAPKGYDRDHPDVDLLQFKQWAVTKPLTDKAVLAPDLVAQTVKVFKILKPLNDWLNSILLA
jgi:uncharacterized protein (TIGR02453 family)